MYLEVSFITPTRLLRKNRGVLTWDGGFTTIEICHVTGIIIELYICSFRSNFHHLTRLLPKNRGVLTMDRWIHNRNELWKKNRLWPHGISNYGFWRTILKRLSNFEETRIYLCPSERLFVLSEKSIHENYFPNEKIKSYEAAR